AEHHHHRIFLMEHAFHPYPRRKQQPLVRAVEEIGLDRGAVITTDFDAAMMAGDKLRAFLVRVLSPDSSCGPTHGKDPGDGKRDMVGPFYDNKFPVFFREAWDPDNLDIINQCEHFGSLSDQNNPLSWTGLGQA